MGDKHADVIRFVNRAFELLDEISYYRLLSLQQNATERDIKGAYYRLAGRLHPDLYGKTLDAELRQKLTTVYSRVVEAYKVLTDGRKRKIYDLQLGRGKVRLTADAEAHARKKLRPEDSIKNPGAKKFYKLGMEALGTGDGKTAVTNLTLALSLEPSNAVIKLALSRAGKK
ncbi:MAG: J domain-containing protein [Deltaproteobacteria bacterium]|jgi:DnaJ-class molecular chaperone|nr:J domain-containing protein [Deltaproteobacteria bacterium]